MDYRAIKENNMFLLTTPGGDIYPKETYGLGLYIEDTRFLSHLETFINGESPILLDSDGSSNYVSRMILTNPHQEEEGKVKLWRESVELAIEQFIVNDVLYEKISFKNFSPQSLDFTFSIKACSDFKDMFLIRGFQSGEIGEIIEETAGVDQLFFKYKGADNLIRSTTVTWSIKGEVDGNDHTLVHFPMHLNPQEEKELIVNISASIKDKFSGTVLDYDKALASLEASHQQWNEDLPNVTSDSKVLTDSVKQGLNDLRVLLTDLGHGPFPVAGLPWFGVPFGRDSLIAAWQMLPFYPEAAKGTLFTMASMQGTKVDVWRDEQPGKIMHEIRYGELANTNQVPFTPYYGTIDATPLFLVLLSEYVKWTGDVKTFELLEEHVERALEWVNKYGDRDQDGFVEYFQESSKGIANQGWKDSADSIVHRSGKYAEAPIALAEVQGYVYHAKSGMAELFEITHQSARADTLRNEAEDLRSLYEDAFWMDDENFYAIALDQNKQQVGTITSNPGHTLISNMISESRSRAVAKRLLSNEMFSGYGIRTMGVKEKAYNPMSYHDGSVWPHDNSLSLLGMSKKKYTEEVNKTVEGLLKAASSFDYYRLPELFCGYDLKRGRLIRYPVACSPQAWAAGTSLTLVQSLLGLFPNVLTGEIHLNPTLINGMNELEVERIPIGRGYLSLKVFREDGLVRTQVLGNTTGLKVLSPQLVVSK
ncbi:glycogen debranching N-terminal domain-containing protein [Halobacillus sp. A5]|uniref:amylo-alpha-1,6-glucosidase n=1 Tax=Halobacillus sp. A5 TaxID=2880263 RepID=UPI0020A680E6|nr:glycogen debranching N-terminal domain-containing protein [Halobacillus sp. A5]MCP3028220.1 amylo-alpha-1,6-glucosidase [Halobacillus sp. A5]